MQLPWGGERTWSQITDGGTIRNSHHREGQYIFGVNLSVHPDHPGVGFALQVRVWGLGVRDHKRGAYIGSRVPSYCRAHEHHSIEEWVFGENGKSHDALVRYYQSGGLRIVRILPEYFQDPESLNYGVLMYVSNCFSKFPLPVFWAFLIGHFGFAFLRMFMQGTQNTASDTPK
jgi:hypothetical protein